jgi:hypothetical protein
MDQRLEKLLTAVQASSVLPMDDGARALLRKLILEERTSVLATAARFSSAAGRAAVELDALRLACSTHQLLQPPIRPHCEFHASVVNSLPAAWPMDGALAVPLAAAGVPEPGGGGGAPAPPPPAPAPPAGAPAPPPPAAGFSVHVPLRDMARRAGAVKRARVDGGDEEEE